MAGFGDYVISYSGMLASQMALNITGQNISNINSPGYTRRTLDVSTFVYNSSGIYRSTGPAAAGAGVMMNGISQLRDPYLDIRFRNQMTGVGATDAMLAGYEEINQIINDVGKDGLTAQFHDLLDKFGKLDANNVGTAEFDNLVKNSAQSLCQILNQLSSRLQSSHEGYEKKYKEEIANVNSIIENIQKLNDQIKKSDITGDSSLELRDKRNVLIDELSQYINIDVKYTSERTDTGIEVEKLIITVPNKAQGEEVQDFTLIDGSNGARISAEFGAEAGPDGDPPAVEKTYALSIGTLMDIKGNPIQGRENGPITVDTGIYGSLQSMRGTLTGLGEYSEDPETSGSRGIPYYQRSLDELARTFADAMNAVNTQDPQGNALTVNGAGNLFATKDGSAQITASNISISNAWRNGDVHIVSSIHQGSGTTANDNISRFQDIFNKDFTFGGAAEGSVIYKGKLEGFYANMQGVLGMDYQMASKMFETYASSADEINNSRDAVYGVNLNEEGINMMQYQKAFAASCRMMTTLDSLMDQVINRMGV